MKRCFALKLDATAEAEVWGGDDVRGDGAGCGFGFRTVELISHAPTGVH